MDDDTNARKLKIKLGDVDYRFAPLTEGQQTALLLSSKNGRMALGAFARVLEKSCGTEAWENIMDRVMDGEISLKELGDALSTLAQASGDE